MAKHFRADNVKPKEFQLDNLGKTHGSADNNKCLEEIILSALFHKRVLINHLIEDQSNDPGRSAYFG